MNFSCYKNLVMLTLFHVILTFHVILFYVFMFYYVISGATHCGACGFYSEYTVNVESVVQTGSGGLVLLVFDSANYIPLNRAF